MPPTVAPSPTPVAVPQPFVPQQPAAPVVAPTTVPPRPTATEPPPAPSVYYPNCAAARAAGAAPMHRGDPGYRPPLDRDNDGIACE